MAAHMVKHGIARKASSGHVTDASRPLTRLRGKRRQAQPLKQSCAQRRFPHLPGPFGPIGRGGEKACLLIDAHPLDRRAVCGQQRRPLQAGRHPITERVTVPDTRPDRSIRAPELCVHTRTPGQGCPLHPDRRAALRAHDRTTRATPWDWQAMEHS